MLPYFLCRILELTGPNHAMPVDGIGWSNIPQVRDIIMPSRIKHMRVYGSTAGEV